MIRQFKAFLTCRRGVSAIEFVLVLPLMLTLVFGVVAVSAYLLAAQKADKLAMTTADNVAQAEVATNSGLEELMRASTQVMSPLPFDNSNGAIVISSVYRPRNVNGIPQPAVVNWQPFGAGGMPYLDTPNLACVPTLLTATEERQPIINMIQALVPPGNAYTQINVGAMWGWRMLSPRWRGEWGGSMNSNGLPRDYGIPGAHKAVVLMTDGNNTMPYQTNNASVTAYGELNEGRLGTTGNPMIAEDALDAKLAQVCNSMKAAGIIIYTIAFGLDVTNDSRDLLRACASEEEYFFDSPSADALSTAFRAIGDSLSSLRVSR